MPKKLKEYLILSIILIFFFILLLNQKLLCLFNQLTGLWCPGCGVTRMFFAMLELDFYKAFRYNPLVFIFMVFFLVYSIYSLIRYKKIKNVSNKVVIILLVSTFLFWILRNLPFFYFLAPVI